MGFFANNFFVQPELALTFHKILEFGTFWQKLTKNQS
jgi:hypothetical protein